MRKFISTLLMGGSFLIAGTALALTAEQSVQKVVKVQNADGTTRIEYVPADVVAPGETIAYTLNLENDDLQPATDLVLTMPVPTEVKYVEGSAAKTGATISYSVDNGETFSSRKELKVIQSNGGYRIAQSEDITHIRWVVAGPIQSGDRDSLSFQGILK